MAQSSFPWENIDTSETQFSQMFRHVNNGVNGTPTTDELEVVAAFSGLAVDVEPGQAMVQGHYYINTTAVTLSLTTADAVNDRIDTVVLRLDPVANTIVAAVVTGTPALSPVAPTLTQVEPYGVYEFPLADVLVPATAGVPGTITDRRGFMGERFGVWTTANRPDPGTGVAFGYNSTLGAAEFYDGTEWRSVAPESLNDIGDVTITSATTGQILEWNGTAWVNGQVDAAGIASDAVTTVKILNANVTREKLASGLAAFTAQQTITASNASWPVPALGSPIVKVTVLGGGGGGGCAHLGAGATGGTTTFNAGGAGSVSAAGGTGGKSGFANTTGTPGMLGTSGGNGATGSMTTGLRYVDRPGNGQSGRDGRQTVAYLNLTGISTVNVTIGLGGAGGTGSEGGSTYPNGGLGGRGEVIVEYVAA